MNASGLAPRIFTVAGQAFHWFDPKRCKSEFRRILKTGGFVALIWNERLVETTPFLEAYENLLKKHGTDYASVDHRNVGEAAMAAFFSPGSHRSKSFSNEQLFDYDALEGRCLSSSYAPNAGSPGHEGLIADLREAFEKHQEDGRVAFKYQTNLYYGDFRE